MQNTMLDSTVSSNSQELFNFNAKHNGEACIESFRPENAHTPNAFRFTIAMLCVIFDVAERTLRDNIDSLLEDEEIAYCDISQYAIPGGNNRTYETTLYNLTVLNRLGMCCFRKNKEAKRVREKFNDVLVNHETQAQPTIYDYARALIAEKERSDALEAQNKVLEAELTSEKEAHEKDNEDFKTGLDILNAQKAQIGSKREATAMATASSARAHQHLAEKILETNASELIALRAAVEEQRSHLWDANQTAHKIYRLNVLKKDYSLNTLQNKARLLLVHFATKLGKPSTPLPNGATYTDSLGRFQPSMSTYYERDVVDAVLDWVVEHSNDFSRVGGKNDPLRNEC